MAASDPETQRIAEKLDEGYPWRLVLPPEARTPSAAGAKLEAFSDRLIEAIEARFESFRVSAEDPENDADAWERALTVRRGWRVGVEVRLSWRRDSPERGTILVYESTKLEHTLLWALVVPSVFLSAALVYVGMRALDYPWSAFPKTLALVGAVVGGLLSLAVLEVLSTSLHRHQSSENARLDEEVTRVILELLDAWSDRESTPA